MNKQALINAPMTDINCSVSILNTKAIIAITIQIENKLNNISYKSNQYE